MPRKRKSRNFFQRTGIWHRQQHGATASEKLCPVCNPLHYVDVPRGSNHYDPAVDCPERNCIVEAINWYLNVLKSKDSPLAEKRIALDFIVHLVGDLHQPLHVGFTDDHGGIATKVTFDGKEQLLHELWDTGLLDTRVRLGKSNCCAGSITNTARMSGRHGKRERQRNGPTNH